MSRDTPLLFAMGSGVSFLSYHRRETAAVGDGTDISRLLGGKVRGCVGLAQQYGQGQHDAEEQNVL